MNRITCFYNKVMNLLVAVIAILAIVILLAGCEPKQAHIGSAHIDQYVTGVFIPPLMDRRVFPDMITCEGSLQSENNVRNEIDSSYYACHEGLQSDHFPDGFLDDFLDDFTS